MLSPTTARRPSLWMLPMIAMLGLASCARTDGGPRDGVWRAVLQVPGGELPFSIEFKHEQGGRVAYLVNGADRTRVNEIAVNDDTVTLRMPGFNNRIEAKLEGDTLSGTLLMVKPKGKDQTIPFRARYGDAFRFSPGADGPAEPGAPDVTGRWAVTFADGGKNSPAVGEFKQQGRIVTGTFLTPTGDHRFLAGELRGRELRLSKFDGGHVFLYHATLAEDGTLAGKFWSGIAFEDGFTARRDDNASLGDADQATKLVSGDRFDFRFPDLGGVNVSLRDQFFKGKVVVVALAGSWCPNCHDEAQLLVDLHKRKREQGFEVVSLMFEQFGDFNRAAEATYRFRERYGIEYTTLIAGISDKDDAASRLPQLNGVFAFPTTLFVDRGGKVRKIHTGFAGPATGEHHTKMVREFERTVDMLLAEPVPPLPPTEPSIPKA
ncbi:MAG: TlpA disulfide reductase family protein [Gammaproteobacteria bacterium]|jgi:thiol-disulfide isomerase/thioredoxin